jgi:hypothetical protein
MPSNARFLLSPLALLRCATSSCGFFRATDSTAATVLQLLGHLLSPRPVDAKSLLGQERGERWVGKKDEKCVEGLDDG